jgi:putative FmdB family regulatory protein
MPLYEYECTACHRLTEKIQKYSDAELTICPHCAGRLERTITAAAISFKGGGWYADGYASHKPAASSEGSGGDGAGSGSDNGGSSSNVDSSATLSANSGDGAKSNGGAKSSGGAKSNESAKPAESSKPAAASATPVPASASKE